MQATSPKSNKPHSLFPRNPPSTNIGLCNNNNACHVALTSIRVPFCFTCTPIVQPRSLNLDLDHAGCILRNATNLFSCLTNKLWTVYVSTTRYITVHQKVGSQHHMLRIAGCNEILASSFISFCRFGMPCDGWKWAFLELLRRWSRFPPGTFLHLSRLLVDWICSTDSCRCRWCMLRTATCNKLALCSLFFASASAFTVARSRLICFYWSKPETREFQVSSASDFWKA